MAENAIILASILGPAFLVMGLSLLLYKKSWVQLVEKYSKDHFQLFPLMFLYLILGLFMVRLFNVWEWNVWLLVTLSGWALFLKGVFYFLAPKEWILPLFSLRNNNHFLVASSFVLLVLGVVLTYSGFLA